MQFNLENKVKKSIKSMLHSVGLTITRKETFERLEKTAYAENDIKLILKLVEEYGVKNIKNLETFSELSRSQLKQDLFVLTCLDFKRNGFFVEFGAADGVHYSNSYLLEREFGWNGILAEPGSVWHKKLEMSRTCHIEKACVWSQTGEKLPFLQTDNAELSTLKEYEFNEQTFYNRNVVKKYEVNTLSLIDLLEKYNAPETIDYISIDTEGSELEILSSFDFSRYRFNVITCEHNYSQDREKIYNLLISNGYKRILKPYSLFDDWYVRESS